MPQSTSEPFGRPRNFTNVRGCLTARGRCTIMSTSAAPDASRDSLPTREAWIRKPRFEVDARMRRTGFACALLWLVGMATCRVAAASELDGTWQTYASDGSPIVWQVDASRVRI